MSSRSKWESFFKEAGIPTHLAEEYAITFTDNRIKLDMLQELNKELLHHLGIKAAGDIIAILRHSKIKYAEMNRNQSPSPEASKRSNATKQSIQLKSTTQKSANKISSIHKPASSHTPAASNVHRPVSVNMTPVIAKDAAKNRTQTKILVPSSSKPKTNRKALSDRFNECEREAKRRKQEEEENEKKRLQENALLKQKTKGTVFTIELPSKQPGLNKETTSVKPKQQTTTLVPARGKTLNRNKQSTSIFDRLGQTTTNQAKFKWAQRKSNVFNRLGGVESAEEIDAAKRHNEQTQKIQKVQTVSRSNVNVSKQTSKNVFNRLGEK